MPQIPVKITAKHGPTTIGSGQNGLDLEKFSRHIFIMEIYGAMVTIKLLNANRKS